VQEMTGNVRPCADRKPTRTGQGEDFAQHGSFHRHKITMMPSVVVNPTYRNEFA